MEPGSSAVVATASVCDSASKFAWHDGTSRLWRFQAIQSDYPRRRPVVSVGRKGSKKEKSHGKNQQYLGAGETEFRYPP